MSYYFPSTTKVSTFKPTVAQPHTLSDCQILLSRNEKEKEQINTELSEYGAKIMDIEKQIASLQSQRSALKSREVQFQTKLKQNESNKDFLTSFLAPLKKQEETITYITRCKDFINRYKWDNPDEDVDVDEDVNEDVDVDVDTKDTTNTKLVLPHDIFDYVKLKFAPLDSFTSDEIKKIAHYLKACELIASLKDDYIPDGYTYGQVIICICIDYNGYKIVDSIIRDHDCHKIYGNVIENLKDINLDTYTIMRYRRVD